MIILYQLFPAFGLPDASPFCIKVETFLRLVQHPYENRYLGYPKNAPRGKLPYIDDRHRRIADSGKIIHYLMEEYRYAINHDLSDNQHATGIAVTRLLEEHLYWGIVHCRWFDGENWPKIRRQFFGGLSFGIRQVVSVWARRHMLNESIGHGMGRHNVEDIIKFSVEDLKAVSVILGDKKFLLGDKLSSYDATVYAFLASVIFASLDTPLKEAARAFPNLSDYCQRMQSTYF